MTRSSALVAWTIFGVWVGLACERSNEAICLEQRQKARHAALQGRLDEANAIIDRVDAECGPNSQSAVHNIRKMIDEKRELERKREEEERKREELQSRFPGKRFVAWATAHPSKVTPRAVERTCAEPGDPDNGFCTAQAPGAPDMTVRYWNDDPTAYLYVLETQAPISCRELEDYRPVRDWQKGTARYELCELTGRELRHLSALLETKPERNRFLIYSQPYLAHDRSLDRLLRERP